MEDPDLLAYIGQKAFIRRGDEVLIVRDPKIGLDFPGGKIQTHETDLAEALKREVREETGLEIEAGDAFTTWMKEFPRDHRLQSKVFLVGYLCRYMSGEVRLSHEHTEYHWVNKTNYHDFKEDSDYFRALEKYFSLA
jgi:8-oxo-dGTP diphosphatase